MPVPNMQTSTVANLSNQLGHNKTKVSGEDEPDCMLYMQDELVNCNLEMSAKLATHEQGAEHLRT